jgi:arylsulfatase A-like enzyme
MRPSTTGIYGLAPGIRAVDATKARITLPQTFTRAGYHTYTCGKIYHDGSMTPKDRAAEFNQWGPAPGAPRPPKPIAKIPRTNPLIDWGPYPERDEDHNDYQIATAAISALREAPTNQPFFIACGFRQPHVPCFAPPKYFDLYPADTLKMPPVFETDRDDTPRFSWFLHWRLPEPRLKLLREHDEWRPLVRAYLAGTSFMDAQVGRLLKALEETGRATNTVVVFWSDHGWHLGEKLITGKNTLWERSTRVPLIFAGPGITAKVARSFPHAHRTLPPRRAEGSRGSQPHAAPARRPGSARMARHHDAQPRQPRRAQRAMALHPLRRRHRGTI